MSVAASVILNVVCYVAGAGTALAVTKLAAARAARGETLMSEPHRDRPPRSPRQVGGLFGILGLTLGVLLAGFGVQQSHNQHHQHEYNACVQAWATDMTDTIATRTDATSKLDAAQKQRADALDNVVLVVIGLRAHPPTATTKDFDRLLQAFAQAKNKLDRVTSETFTTRRRNPFPVLSCD